MKTRTLFRTTLFVLLGPVASLAAQQPDTVVLGGVVISATKGPLPPAALTQSVTVISGEDLRVRGVTSVAEALRGVPGVAVAATGSFGALTSVFVRGGESRYTKFLVDGVPVNAVGGLFDAAHLGTANVERIEIVRGASSVVHGADAVSGVVQIFTRRGSGPVTFSSEARGGTYGTLEAAAGVSGSPGRTAFTLHGARNSTDGILPFNNEYLNETASGSLAVLRSETSSLSIAGRATHAVAHYPTDYIGNVVDSNSFRDQRRLTLSLDGAHRIKPGVELRLLGGMNDATDFTDDITAGPGGDTRDRYTSSNLRYRGEGRLSVGVPFGRFTSGVEYQREREQSGSAAGPPDGALTPYSRFAGTRSTRAAYGEYLASIDRLALDLSGRLDDPSDFDRAGTYRVGSAFRVLDGTRVRGSLSTSFNAPAFFYLFDTDFTTGNLNLEPERARSFELSLEQSVLRGIVSVRATYFDQRFSQLIEFVPGGAPDFVGTYANLNGATSSGHELEILTARRRGWAAHASYTVLRSVVSELGNSYQGSASVGDELLRRPRRSGTAGASFSASSGAILTLAGRHVGRRPDLDFRTFPSPRVMLPSVTLIDLAAAMPVFVKAAPRLALTLRVDNLFDKSYQEVFNFDAPGRRVLIGGSIDASRR